MRECVIIATYNNGSTLRDILDQTLSYTSDLIVVNDGSDDQTSEILADYDSISVIHHENNLGKGMALRNAFDLAIEKEYDYAITLDSDGQHNPKDIPQMKQAIRDYPGEMIMGVRDMTLEEIPGRSSFGHKFSNFWFWVETGKKVGDTQTGYRAYPLKPLKDEKWFTKRFEFEIEVLVRLAWKGVDFKDQNVAIRYQEDRVSHFRPFMDFARISVLNTVLVTIAILFIHPRNQFRNFSLKGIYHQVKAEFQKTKSPPIMASSVALGLFMGVFPIWGFQMITAFSLASWFKLNRVIVLVFANISIPPLIPIIIYCSFLTGGVFFRDRVQFENSSGLGLESIHLHLFQYITGAVLLSFILGGLGFIIAYIMALIKK